MGKDKIAIGSAGGWEVEEDGSGGFRWSAFGPRGSRQGHAAEAEAAARRAELEVAERPSPSTAP